MVGPGREDLIPRNDNLVSTKMTLVNARHRRGCSRRLYFIESRIVALPNAVRVLVKRHDDYLLSRLRRKFFYRGNAPNINRF